MTPLVIALARLALALLASGVAFLVVTRLARRAMAAMPDAWNRLGLALLVSTAIAAVAWPAGTTVVEPPLRVMAESSATGVSARAHLAWPEPLPAPSVDVSHGAASVLLASLTLGVLVLVLRLAVIVRRTQLACRRLPVVHRRGRVSVRAGDAGSPCSFQGFGEAFVVLPERVLLHPRDRAYALDHESHHLRHGHGRVALGLSLLDCAFLKVPVLAPWRAAFADVHEAASDARALRRRGASRTDYSRCLVEAAAHASRRPAVGLTMAASSASLRRRLRVIADRPSSPLARLAAALTCAAAVASSAVVASAAIGPSDPSIDLARAEAAASATPPGGLVVPFDDAVVDALRRRLGSPEGREATREALRRMPDHAPLMTSVLRDAGLPDELLAVVLVESGFRVGVSPSSRPLDARAAGPWQFIPSTARRHGLRVEDGMDERLEPRRSTEAAASLLLHLHERFGDWPLALQAYNQGEAAVERAIEEAGTRDALELERRGRLSPYASRVLAGVLVLRDPRLVE